MIPSDVIEAKLDAYKFALKEWVQPVLKKSGVISMIAVSDKTNPSPITVFRIISRCPHKCYKFLQIISINIKLQ